MGVSKEWKFDNSFLRKTHNREVHEYFKDLTEDDLEDLEEPRKVAYRACLILAKTSQLSAIQKQLTFRFIVQRCWEVPHVYGMPISQAYEEFAFKPQIQLYFRQDLDAVADDFEPMEGVISFRLMDETSETITESKLTSYAHRIKEQFGGVGEQIWKKGKHKLCYKDLKHGLDLRILCLNETEGKEIIQRVCRIAEATFDDDNLTPIAPNKASINNPGTTRILGKQRKKKRWRPTGNVRFRHAIAVIDGLSKAVPLFDLSGRYLDPLV
jgi:hypothetical protein